jgi:hypothetical protein
VPCAKHPHQGSVGIDGGFVFIGFVLLERIAGVLEVMQEEQCRYFIFLKVFFHDETVYDVLT